MKCQTSVYPNASDIESIFPAVSSEGNISDPLASGHDRNNISKPFETDKSHAKNDQMEGQRE